MQTITQNKSLPLKRFRLPPGPSSTPIEQTKEFTYNIIPFLDRCQQNYGNCFTLRLAGMPDMVIVSDPDLARQVFADKDSCFDAAAANRKTMVGTALGRHFLMVLSGETHKLMQRKLKHIISDISDKLIDDVRQLTLKKIENWPINQTFPLRKELQDLSLEIMLTAALGADSIVPRKLLIRAIHHMVDTTLLGGQPTMLPNAPAFLTAREAVYELFDREIKHRKLQGRCGRSDMLSRLVDPAAEDQVGHLKTSQLRDQLLAMSVAGYDTTATTLAWTFFHLLRANSLNQELLIECKAIAGQETLTPSHLSNEKRYGHLKRSIAEAERLHPVTPIVNRMTTKAVQLGEWLIPKDVMVCPSLHLLHRDHSWQDSINSFVPERNASLKPFHPFGGGSRMCVGQVLVKPEMLVIVATIIANADLNLISKHEITQRRAFALVPKNGVRVVMQGRKNNEQ